MRWFAIIIIAFVALSATVRVHPSSLRATTYQTIAGGERTLTG
jgi:hypothetical protein